MQNQSSNKSSTLQKPKAKTKPSKRQRNRRKKKLFQQQQNKSQSPHLTDGSVHKRSGADIWRQVYENSIRWHAEHQGNFWRQVALNLESENHKLQSDLDEIRSFVHHGGYKEEDPTMVQDQHTSTGTQDKSEEVDTGYLEFLETTIKHQKEIQMMHQLEDE